MQISYTDPVPWYEILGILLGILSVFAYSVRFFKSYQIDPYLSGIWKGELLYTDPNLASLKLKCTIVFVSYSNTNIEGYLYYSKKDINGFNTERGLDKLHEVNGRVFFDRKLQIKFLREFSTLGIEESVITFDCNVRKIVTKPTMYVKYKLKNGTFAEGNWTKK